MTGYFFHEDADVELVDVARYYEGRSRGLGRAFLAEIDRAIAAMLSFPESAPLVTGAVRRMSLRRFPYDLLYAIEDDRLRILAVAHHRRRPLYWASRM